MAFVGRDKMNNNQTLLFFLFILSLLHGCTALQSFPHAARSGDTVALAVGSPLNMARENTTATLTDINDVVTDITSNIRSIFKLYADPDSKVYNYSTPTWNLVSSSGHAPWISIVVLDLPVGLPEGSASIKFNTTATYPSIGSHLNDRELAIEILPGEGVSNDFTYEFGVGSSLPGNLNLLEPQPRAIYGHLFPSTECPCPDYAAIEVRTTISTNAGVISNDSIRVVPQDLTLLTYSGRDFTHGVTSAGDELLVTFLSTDGTLKHFEAQFSVVLYPNKFNGTPVIDSIKYFDIDGNEVAGPASEFAVSLK